MELDAPTDLCLSGVTDTSSVECVKNEEIVQEWMKVTDIQLCVNSPPPRPGSAAGDERSSSQGNNTSSVVKEQRMPKLRRAIERTISRCIAAARLVTLDSKGGCYLTTRVDLQYMILFSQF